MVVKRLKDMTAASRVGMYIRSLAVQASRVGQKRDRRYPRKQISLGLGVSTPRPQEIKKTTQNLDNVNWILLKCWIEMVQTRLN